MASLSTLGQMMMHLYPDIKDWNTTQLEANRIQSGNITNQTGLLELAELRRQQQVQEAIRQHYQQHPEALFGGQPTSTLGTLQTTPAPGGAPAPGAITQQAFGPGGVGPTQTIPAPMQPNANLGAMPGGAPLSTLATLGTPPQAPRNPLMDLARANPDAALAVLNQQTRMQDVQFRVQEQRLTIGTKVAQAIGRIAQGVTDQASLDQARQQVTQISPQAAAQLPQFYSKEAMIPFIKQAVSVEDNAKLQLETWKTQNEMARLGLQGEPAAMVSELRAMGVNPLTATPEQRQQAQKNIQARSLEYAGEEQRQKQLGEQQFRQTQPLQDARKEDAGLFVYKGTGQPVSGTTPYSQVQKLQDEPDPTKGVVKLGSTDEKKQLTTLKQLEPVLQQYADLVQYAYGTDPKTGKKGPMADYQRGPFQTIGAMWNQLSQDDPVFQAKRRALQGQLQSVVRGLGARGDLNEQELTAATQMLANMDASLGLGLSLGPMVGTGGFGVGGSIKPSISLPDTPETGINIANELIGTVNRRIGSLLQHEGYNKTPYIRIRTDQESEAKPGEMPRATPRPAPGPAPVPEPGPPLFPRPQIVIPGEGAPPPLPPAPSTRPTPPTATSTPAQDEAYRQSVGQGTSPTPAPSVPPTRSTPGRQSQAPPAAGQTRVARASGPKVMNLADVAEAMRQTGRSRREVEAAARARGYTVYGSRLPLPGETRVV